MVDGGDAAARAAVSRSIVDVGRQALSRRRRWRRCAAAGDLRQRVDQLGAHVVELVACRRPPATNWYWVGLTVGVDGQVLHRLHVERDAGDRCARLAAAGRMIASLVAVRPCGFRLISIRPLLSVMLLPSTPMKRATGCRRPDPSGSRSASCCWRSAIALEGDAWRRLGDALDQPVSCTGNKPFGIDDVQQDGQHQRAERHQQRERSGGRAPSSARGRSGRSTLSKQRSAMRRSALALASRRSACSSARAQHRHQRQRHHRRDQDGDRQRDRELAEQAARPRRP